MGNLNPPVKFCEGCPFANGVIESDTVLGTPIYMMLPHPPISIQFEGANGDRTYIASTKTIYGEMDTTMLDATAADVIEKVRACHEVPTQKILGFISVKSCGAFPNKNPRKPVIQPSSNGWMYY